MTSPLLARAANPILTETKGKQDFDGTIDGVGYKQSMDDPKKLPLSLVPPELVEQAARVMAFGARKYARGQWMRGMGFSSPTDALKRHIQAWERGEDVDADSGLPHLAHAAACISFLLHFTEGPRAAEYARFDDRLFVPREVPF
jgi:hypothetical protein